MYALQFLLQTAFTVYLVILWLRILLPFVHASYHHPLSQFIIKLTNPLILPTRKIIPNHQYIDGAAIIVLLFIAVLKLYLLYWLFGNHWLSLLEVALLTIGEVLQLLLMIFFWALMIQAVLSWVIQPNDQRYGHLQNILFHLTQWMLKPIRRLIPPIGGVDLAPLPVLIILYLLNYYIGFYTVGFVNV